MNGETLELESGDKATVAHDGDGGRVTITAQGGGRVAVAHLTTDEATAFADSVLRMASHVIQSAADSLATA